VTYNHPSRQRDRLQQIQQAFETGVSDLSDGDDPKKISENPFLHFFLKRFAL
jgi:hypothetical protein